MSKEIREESITIRVSKEEKKELLCAWVDGKEIEWYSDSDCEWHLRALTELPIGLPHTAYRIAKTPITFDWSQLKEEYKYIAKDYDGAVWAFTAEPFFDDEGILILHSPRIKTSEAVQLGHQARRVQAPCRSSPTAIASSCRSCGDGAGVCSAARSSRPTKRLKRWRRVQATSLGRSISRWPR